MKKTINNAYLKLCKCSKLTTEWERILSKESHQIFKYKNTHYKVESIIYSCVNPFPFCSDIHNFTRRQWDNGISIIIYNKELEVVGIERGYFWKNESLCIFQSQNVLYGCWVRRIKDNTFFVCQMVITSTIQVDSQQLLDRAIQLQKAVDDFPTLYDPILCSGCRQKIPSWCLECNRSECKVERFGRCKDMQCWIPSESKDQEKCKKCGGEVEKIKF